MLTSSTCWGFQFCNSSKILCVSLKVKSVSCPKTAPPLSLYPLPALISSPLELMKGHGIYFLQEMGDMERFCAQEPHRVLLGFTMNILLHGSPPVSHPTSDLKHTLSSEKTLGDVKDESCESASMENMKQEEDRRYKSKSVKNLKDNERIKTKLNS